MADSAPQWLLDLVSEYHELLDLDEWRVYLLQRGMAPNRLGECTADPEYKYAHVTISTDLTEVDRDTEETVAHELGHVVLAELDAMVLGYIIPRFITSRDDQENCTELYRFQRERVIERYARALVKARGKEEDEPNLVVSFDDLSARPAGILGPSDASVDALVKATGSGDEDTETQPRSKFRKLYSYSR